MKKIIDKIKNKCNYEIRDDKLIINNNDNNNYIEIIKDHDEYIISFKTQHCHFDDYNDCIDYLNNIMNDKILAIEFYLGNKAVFGGDISIESFNNLSIDVLNEMYGFIVDDINNYDYVIYSWSGKNDTNRVSISSLKK